MSRPPATLPLGDASGPKGATSPIAVSAPGKLMLAGEYAVLEGAPAVMMAVDRRVRAAVPPAGEIDQRPGGLARDLPAPPAPSPYLLAVHRVLAAELGPVHKATLAALRVVADSSALRDGPSGVKLGLGSSAAVTVCAVAAALAASGQPLDRSLIHRLAHRAHGDAQANESAETVRGSGADIAASVWGGITRFVMAEAGEVPGRPAPLVLPEGLSFVPVWTGVAADTRVLVAAVRALAARDKAAYLEAIDSLAAAAQGLIAACGDGDPGAALNHLRAARDAAGALGDRAKVAITNEVHRELNRVAEQLGGVVKPTGAGGGDLALGAFLTQGAATSFREQVAGRGMKPLDLAVSTHGVTLESPSAP